MQRLRDHQYKHTQHTAWEFILTTDFDTLPISIRKIKKMIRQKGWEIYTYSNGRELLEQLHMSEMVTDLNGFTTFFLNRRIIFYNNDLPRAKRLFVIAHEIGHIVLKHVHIDCEYWGRTEKEKQEQEADIFAIELLAPSCVLKECGAVTRQQMSALGILECHFFFILIIF